MANESGDPRQPNFLIVGAQKCGTTWLHALLSRHPEIAMPLRKETEFFSYSKNLSDEGYAEYLQKHFGKSENKRARGESCPSYFWNSKHHAEWNETFPVGFEPEIPGAVMRFLGPDVKIVVSLRDPVARAASAHLHHIRTGITPLRTRLFEVGKRHGIIHMGFYHAHLAEWLKLFSPGQVKVLIFEEAVREPEKTWEELCAFLGVSVVPFPAQGRRIFNRGLLHVRHEGHYYIPSDFATKLAFCAIRKFRPDFVNLTGFHRAVDRFDLADLAEIYQDDVAALSEQLKQDLSAQWLARHRVS